jgi:hypothetical protein
MSNYTSYKSLQLLVKSYIKAINLGDNLEKQFRDLLIYLNDKNYINQNLKGLDLRKKKNKEQLLIYGSEFLKAKLICKITLAERGWTKELIETHLYKPDIIEVNPQNRRYIHLYSLCKIEHLETKPKIKDKLVVDLVSPIKPLNKNQDIYEWIEQLQINVPLLPIDVLLKNSLFIYNETIAKEDIDKRNLYTKAHTLEALCFNYLRHECTRYDHYLLRLNNVTNGDAGYTKIKEYINQKIKETYPDLKSIIYKYQNNHGYIVQSNVNKRA